MELTHTPELAWAYDLYRIGQAIANEAPGEVQHKILEFVVSGFRAGSGTVALLDETGQQLTIVAGIGNSAHFIGKTIAVGEKILGWVAQHGEPLLLNGDISNDPRFRNLVPPSSGTKPPSAMCWPLKVGHRVIGAFSVNRAPDMPAFTGQDLEQAGAVVQIMSLALDNARLHADQQRRIAALSVMNAENEELIRKIQEVHTQLLQSEKMASIGQLAAGVAHEINNPVGYINSNIGTLQRYVADLFRVLESYQAAEPELPPGGETLRRIQAVRQEVDLDFLRTDVLDLMRESQEGVKRVRQIVQDLKDFSHVDEAEWQLVDLHKGLDSTLNIVNNEIKYKAEVVKHYGDLPAIACLPSQINQVFMNILVNAAQSIEAHGTITMSTGRSDDEVWVEIADSGKGIPPENLKRIFDPFFTTKPVGKGTGLGLSLSYGIIQKHGGRIAVQSEVGKGTSFRIFLPITQPTAQAVA